MKKEIKWFFNGLSFLITGAFVLAEMIFKIFIFVLLVGFAIDKFYNVEGGKQVINIIYVTGFMYAARGIWDGAKKLPRIK